MTEADRGESVNRSLLADPGQFSQTEFSEESKSESRLAIVIVTRNREKSLLRTLDKLSSLEEKCPIVLVDNASEDNTLKVVRSNFPDVRVLALDENHGAVARNFGAELVDQPYVAFSDDDSWWAPGSLSQAIEFFDNYPELGLIMSKILIEPGGRYDPCCRSMEDSPLPNHFDLPGFPILGFIACGAIVRRSAFHSAGGFNPDFGTWGEEDLLSIDMAKNGWGLSYIPDILSHHQPSKTGRNRSRKLQEVRNNLWTCWMRRSPSAIFQMTVKYMREAFTDREVYAGVKAALKGTSWVTRKRNPVPGWLENQLVLKEAKRGDC